MIDISKSDVSLQETIDKLNDGDILYLGNRIFNEKVVKRDFNWNRLFTWYYYFNSWFICFVCRFSI